MATIIHEHDINEQDLGALKVRELYRADDDSVSFAKVSVQGNNETNKNMVSDMHYYVLEGSGVFVIDGKEHDVKQGDLVIIPKGSVYQDIGELVMLSVACPVFDAGKVEYFE